MYSCVPHAGAGNLIPNLGETIKCGVTLISIDCAGYGLPDNISGERWISVSEAAEDIAEIVENVASEPIGLVGWSLGGWVTLALAANRPGLVDRLAIIGNSESTRSPR
ncbi:MAG: alpha/beta hydrolase [Chloroflexota bacterium]